MGTVEFGLILPENPWRPPARERYLEDVNRLLAAANGSFASAWCIDHLQGDVLDGSTTICYLSALHPGMTWGNTALSQTFRNPALVAKMGATLQFLTGGRFALGIGAGEHYWIENAACGPMPDAVPPIAVGAFGPKVLRLVARHADWWNVSSTGIAAYGGYVDELERACDEVGRDPATLRRVRSGGCTCAPTEAEVERLTAGWPQDDDDDFDFAVTPAQMVE